MQKVKETEKESLETSYQENGFWLGALETAHMLGWDPVSIAHRTQRTDTLTQENIHDAARKYFPTDRYTLMTLMDQKSRAELGKYQSPNPRARRAALPSAAIYWAFVITPIYAIYLHDERPREGPSSRRRRSQRHLAVVPARREDRRPRPQRLRQELAPAHHGGRRHDVHRRGVCRRWRVRRLPAAGAAARPGQDRPRQRREGVLGERQGAARSGTTS